MAQIKDYVEVAAYDEQSQFRDTMAERVVSSYLMTESTAVITARLLEYLGSSGRVPPRLICGPQGVGKSHLLAVIHRLSEHAALRAKIHPPQVQTAATRLGALLPITLHLDNDLRTPFGDALAAGVRAATHGTISFSPSGDRHRDLSLLAESSPQDTVVLLVDGLSARMRAGLKDRSEDDLAWLKAIAATAQAGRIKAIFTLDEDLSKNHAALRPVIQDYLPHHLGLDCLKELISHRLFRKSGKQQSELQALYRRVRERLPTFRWTQEDFVALYPLHPILLEVAPAIRAHTPAFSLLGFASSAAVRAMGRPPLSVIMLDEVFDRFEYELRKSETLGQAFSAYDKLANAIPAKAPIAQRMTTRLLLKSLLIISLTGRSSTKESLAEALMLVDERVDGYQLVAECLPQIEQKAGESMSVHGAGMDRSYQMVVGDENNLETTLKADAAAIDDQDPRLLDTLVGIGGRHFADWPFLYDRRTAGLTSRAVMRVLWRGAEREGILCFNRPVELAGDESAEARPADPTLGANLLELDLEAPAAAPLPPTLPSTVNETDWQVVLLPPDAPVPDTSALPGGVLYWVTQGPAAGAGQPDWRVAVKQFIVAQRLSTESVRISPRLELLLSELRTRVIEAFQSFYLTGGRLLGPGYNTPAAEWHKGTSIAESLARLLDPVLAARFPQHPKFGGLITLEKVDLLVRGLMCGSNPADATVQTYAEQFAGPMALTARASRPLKLDIESDECVTSPAMAAVRRMIDGSPEGVVSLADATACLRRTPLGLQAPAQRLLLAALVAGWQVELTNTAGSQVLTPANLSEGLDLGKFTLIRRTSVIAYSTERLSEWCARLLGQNSWFDLRTTDGRRHVREGFAEWQQKWDELNLDPRVAALPDEMLTTRVAQMHGTCKRYFDRMAAAVTAMLQGRVPLEQGLAHIVDIFAGNEQVFDRLAQELRRLSSFLDWAPWAGRLREYVLTADYSNNDILERMRQQLAGYWEEPNCLLDEAPRQRLVAKVEEFKKAYQAFYIAAHQNKRRNDALNGYGELLESYEWVRCQIQTQAAGLTERRLAITGLVNELSLHTCHTDVAAVLENASYCNCGLSLFAPNEPERLLSILRRLLGEEVGAPPAAPASQPRPTGDLPQSHSGLNPSV